MNMIKRLTYILYLLFIIGLLTLSFSILTNHQGVASKVANVLFFNLAIMALLYFIQK